MNSKFKRMFRSLIVITAIYSLASSNAQRQCTNDTECVGPDERCLQNFCGCVPGLVLEADVCVSEIGRTCMTSPDCVAEGTWCDPDSTCQCDPSAWVVDGDRCFSECTIGVSSLHDMSRRLKSYVGSFGEPLVTDHRLAAEGWYSLAQYRIINSAAGLMPGTCGSFHQIILKDDVSVDWDNLDLNEVTLQATVVGLQSGTSEDLEIRVRKCLGDNQYYLMRPRTRFAAYCFESPEETSNEPEIEEPLVLPVVQYIYIESSLSFMKELRDGISMDIPYVLWNCQLRYYLLEVQNVAEAEFIRVTWFANSVLIRSSGINRLTDVINDIENSAWPGAQLTEMDLLEAGFSMGIVLRCGVQLSRTETSRMSAMTPGILRLDMLSSEAGYAAATGEIFMSLNSNKNLLQHQSNIPLGCARSEDTVEETCSLKLDVIPDDGSSVCSDTHFGNEHSHELCGLTLIGLTRHGLEMHGNVYNALDFSYNSSYENGTQLTEIIGTHIMLESSTEELEPGARIVFSVSVSENTAGHRLWDGYTARNIEVIASEVTFSGYHACAVGQTYIEATGGEGLAIYRFGYDYNGLSSEQLEKTIAFEESGKYILLWSGQFPFTFEIEVETKDGHSYVCRGTMRYGNDVFTYSICGGGFIQGLVAGDGKYLPEVFTGQLHIKELDLYMNPSIVNSELEVTFYSYSTDFSKELEGLCASGMNGMLGRDGNIYDVVAEFIDTWRIENDESLTNPDNQVLYKVESKYYTCGCPAKTENVPNRVAVNESAWYVYTGVLHCKLDEYCTGGTEGEVWKETLLPSYLIGIVEIVPKVLIDPIGQPILQFICQFHVFPQFYYKVQWFIDDVLFKEVGPVLPVNEALFTITDDEIHNSNTYFHFDMKMQCTASILRSDDEVLISPISSVSFYPIQITSTNVSSMRGGDTTVSFRSFIPFECFKGVPDCHMEIKLSDPNDDCEKSSVAIKSKDHCGGRIRITSGDVAAIGSEITTVLTIKNNDKNDLKTVFDLDIVVLFHSTGKPFWTGPLEQKITAEVTDKIIDWIGPECHMNVDPHMCNFDGNYYENQNEGQFTLLKSKTLPLEVQAITSPCEDLPEWGPTCACAAIIKAGGDIYLIDHCTKDHHFTGFISALDKITTVYEKSETRYQVIVPNTMMIDISVMHYKNDHMNILILPSPMDKNNTEGLCGNFNGIPDDFVERDTANAGDNNEFSMSWELLENDRWNENLLNPDNYRNPTRWNTEEKLCNCPNAANDFNVAPICSVNEEDTCIRSKPRKGRKQNVETRHKRDANFINLDIEKRLERLRNFVFEQHATKRKKRSSGVQSNVTEEEARALCVDAFNNCPAYGISNKPVNESSYLADCIKDVVASKGDISWAGPQCDSLAARLDIAIEQDVEYAQNNPEAVAEVERLCPGNCNNHGTCNDGTCQCDVGWGSENCLVNKSKAVEITYITGSGLCDLNKTENGNCEDMVVVGNGFTRDVQSKVDVYEAGKDGVFKKSQELNRPAEYRSFNEVIVDITGARRRRSTSTGPVVAHQYGVSVSNDGTIFGSVVFVTVLDTTCQEMGNDTDGNTKVFLKAGFCYIEGRCYSEGNSSATSSCNLCRTAVDLFDWTEENCPTTTAATATSSDDSDIPIYAIILGVIGGVLVIGAIGGLIIFQNLSKRRPVIPLPEAPPPYSSPRPGGPMNVRYHGYYINPVMVAEADAKKKKAPI